VSYNLEKTVLIEATNSHILALETASSVPILRPYARSVNAKYHDGASVYFSIKDRWNFTLATLPPSHRNSVIARLKNLEKQFKARYPNVKALNDPSFRLCRALKCPLSNILIDSTIQRKLDIEWVLTILDHFVAHQAMPIQVYAVPEAEVPARYNNNSDFYASWDGQHTAVVFWIINTIFLSRPETEAQVPVVEYDIADRQECRMTFINNNSKDGKKLLDPIDKVIQMIYGVILDGVEIPEWKNVYAKQQHLETYDLFLTSDKFFDHNEPGAITRVKDVTDDSIPVELVRQFTVYADHVLAEQNRPIDTKELPIILGFLKMAMQDNIQYTDDEIRSLADLCLTKFNADFDEDGKFWRQVGVAYTKWHNKQYKDYDETIRPGIRLNKDWIQGGTFFYFQLYFTWLDQEGQRQRLPKLNISTPFLPSKTDVFK
jgi:hypothetical protein